MKGFLFGLSILIAAVAASLVTATAFATAPAVTFVDPSPDEAATLTSDSVQFAFTFNRQPKSATLTCALAGPTPSSGPCDMPVAFGDKGASSGASYGGLANGEYTFTVALSLDDGGSVSATRDFTVDVLVGPQVYWTTNSAVGRANLDGTGVNQSLISVGGLTGLAVDSGHLYWSWISMYGGMAIGRSNLNGTGANYQFIGAYMPFGLAVDTGHVYWTNYQLSTIGRADLDGTGVDQSFITGASHPEGVAVDAG